MRGSEKMTVLGVEGIEDGLMGIGRAIEAGGPWMHPEMARIPEWRGADVRITSDFEKDFNDPGYFDHDLTVRTRHAGPVTWFIFQMRDLFDGWLDWGNKYGFYELLAQAALEHLAANQPEPEDARPLLRAILTRAFLMLEVAKEHHASQEIGDGIWKIGSGGRWEVEGGRFGEGKSFRKTREKKGIGSPADVSLTRATWWDGFSVEGARGRVSLRL